MKTFLFTLAAVTGALAILVAKQQKTAAAQFPLKNAAPVDDLAHKLQDAWADHHTVA